MTLARRGRSTPGVSVATPLQSFAFASGSATGNAVCERVCGRCGARFKDGDAKFCSECGSARGYVVLRDEE